MAHLDLANLRTTLLDDTQLAAVAPAPSPAICRSAAGIWWSAIRLSGQSTSAGRLHRPLGRHPVEIIVHSSARRWPWSGSSAKPSLRLPCTGRWRAGPRDLTGLDEDSIGYRSTPASAASWIPTPSRLLLALIERADGDEDNAWSDA